MPNLRFFILHLISKFQSFRENAVASFRLKGKWPFLFHFNFFCHYSEGQLSWNANYWLKTDAFILTKIMLDIELARLYMKLSIFGNSGYVHNSFLCFPSVLSFGEWYALKCWKKIVSVQDAWTNWNFSGVKLTLKFKVKLNILFIILELIKIFITIFKCPTKYEP